jgi:hypothetical protein
MYSVDFDDPDFCDDGAMATAASRRDETAEEKALFAPNTTRRWCDDAFIVNRDIAIITTANVIIIYDDENGVDDGFLSRWCIALLYRTVEIDRLVHGHAMKRKSVW